MTPMVGLCIAAMIAIVRAAFVLSPSRSDLNAFNIAVNNREDADEMARVLSCRTALVSWPLSSGLLVLAHVISETNRANAVGMTLLMFLVVALAFLCWKAPTDLLRPKHATVVISIVPGVSDAFMATFLGEWIATLLISPS